MGPLKSRASPLSHLQSADEASLRPYLVGWPPAAFVRPSGGVGVVPRRVRQLERPPYGKALTQRGWPSHRHGESGNADGTSELHARGDGQRSRREPQARRVQAHERVGAERHGALHTAARYADRYDCEVEHAGRRVRAVRPVQREPDGDSVRHPAGHHTGRSRHRTQVVRADDLEHDDIRRHRRWRVYDHGAGSGGEPAALCAEPHVTADPGLGQPNAVHGIGAVRADNRQLDGHGVGAAGRGIRRASTSPGPRRATRSAARATWLACAAASTP